MADIKQELLGGLPSITTLPATDAAQTWCHQHPKGLDTDCTGQTLEDIRRQIRDSS